MGAVRVPHSFLSLPHSRPSRTFLVVPAHQGTDMAPRHKAHLPPSGPLLLAGPGLGRAAGTVSVVTVTVNVLSSGVFLLFSVDCFPSSLWIILS